ncbi:uncharacterized protein LOC122876757 [Xyrichtys novacula]|nr:uncharacterized protein LOC122876757 [Xyrichtys novacula]
MAGGMRKWRALRLLIFFSLLSLSGQFEVKEDEWEELGTDIAALHRLKGLSEQMFHERIQQPRTQRDASIHVTRVKRSSKKLDLDQNPTLLHDELDKCQESFTSCVIQAEQDLESFLSAIDDHKIQDWLFSASEVSYSYSQKLLVMTDEDEATKERVQQEYILDPLYSVKVSRDCLNNASCLPGADGSTVVKIFGKVSDDGHSVSGLSGSSLAELMLMPSFKGVPVFSLDGNTTADFHRNFVRVLMVHGNRAVLETNKGNDKIYQVMNEPDTVSTRQLPQQPIDHTTQYDNQHILMLQDNSAVRAAAEALYEKHPSSSSLYILDNNQIPKLVKGEHVPLSENSRLSLVGHGHKDSSEKMKLAGFTASQIEKIVERTDRIGDKIKTINIVGCDVGSDESFAETLLKGLHDNAGIETALHLRDTVIQVKSTGEKITQEITTDGVRWRLKDETSKLVATLDANGNVITRQKSDSKGKVVFTDERNILGKKQIEERFLKYRHNSPKDPKRFINEKIFKEFPNPEQVRGRFDELQAMSWGLFHEEVPLPPVVNTENLEISSQYEIGIKRNNKMLWVSTEKKKKEILSKCYEIKSGEDVRSVIHNYATEGQDDITYLMINDWILSVDPQSLYVYPIGKKLDNNQRESQQRKEIRGYIEEQIGNEKYPEMQRHILGNSPEAEYTAKTEYANFVRNVFVGDRTASISPSTEAWYATHFAASVISESVRNFRTLPLVLMALTMTKSDNNNVREKGLSFLFEEHPMARGGSWIDPGSRGHFGTATPEGSSKLTNKYNPSNLGQLKNALNKVLHKEDAFNKFWSETYGGDVKSQLLKMAENFKLTGSNEEGLKTISKNYEDFKNTLEAIDFSRASADSSIIQASGALGGYDDGHVTSQDIRSASQLENSVKLESYYSRARALSSEELRNHIQTNYGENLKGLRVKEGSAKIKNGQFICHLEVDGVEPRELKFQLSPESQHYNEKVKSMINTVAHETDTHSTVSAHTGNNIMEHAATTVGALGLLLGLKGAVRAFEEGHVKEGVIGTFQTVHGVAAITTSAIAKVALSSETRIAKAAAVIMKNPAMKGTMAVIPLVGIGFGIYNVGQDLARKDTLGYIDAAFDGTMVALDFVELFQPELMPFIAPVNLALSTVRMVFDDIFMGVQDELNSLPPDAGILEKVVAVALGIEEGIFDFEMHVLSIIFDFHYDEIKQGQKIVEEMSDYHRYYKVITQDDGTSAIDFNLSWNGGGIQFVLAEQGPSELCMDYFLSRDEKIRKRCWSIDTKGSNDIILGLGQSHQLEYKELEMKVLFFIPVGTVTVVSNTTAIQSSRYGRYTGNSNANRFFAIQTADHNHPIEYMLSYYYILSGEPGDDIFFLGPQRSYVYGAGGKDTYLIPKKGGKTIINNYDQDKAQDTLHFSVPYRDISVSKSGDSVVLMYEGSHTVMIEGWFLGDTYQHMNMMSEDGVLFEISPTVISSVQLVAKGINCMFEKQGRTVNTLVPLLQTVINILGSKYDDVLIGNEQRNLLDGGGGHDLLKGGEGEDMYIVKSSTQSSIVIDNYSDDAKTDLVTIEANLHSFSVRVDHQNLLLYASRDNTYFFVTLKGWFISPAHRHLFIVTKDMITFTLSDNVTNCMSSDPFTRCIRSSNIDYSKSPSALVVDLEKDEALDGVTEIRGSHLSDVIRGNKEHNVIIPGEGNDYVEGRGGEDWYVITPGQGTKTINNQSPDTALDYLFLKEGFQNIVCDCKGQNIIISLHGRVDIILQNWFVSKNHQHLQIKTGDGVTAGLISDISNCDRSLMLPLTFDFTKQNPEPLFPFRMKFLRWLANVESDSLDIRYYPHYSFSKRMALTEIFSSDGKVMVMDRVNSVKEMLGSPGFDIMVGNSNANVLDPYTGGALLIGGGGKDIYRIKRGYGYRIMIDNFAEDQNTDTVLVDMDFLSGSQVTLDSYERDVIISITTNGEKIRLQLLNYNNGFQHQHVEFQSSDGVKFLLKSGNSTGEFPTYEMEAFKVTLKTSQVDCRLDLSSQTNLSQVHTVQGCPSLSNNILGNAHDNALIGGWKNDVLEGGAGKDTLIGGAGNDILIGGIGDDTLYGEDGNDTMMGNFGSDVFFPGPGADLVDGGPGKDTVLYRGDHDTGKGVYVNLLIGQGRYADAEGDVLKDVETVIGTIYSDILVSGYESCLLKGSDGDDILVSTGDDYLIGDDGNDIYMLAFHHGAVTINNCAKDNAMDVLYLSSGLTPTFDHQLLSDGVLLTFYGQNQTTIKIFLKGWVNDSSECGHLRLIFSDVEVSVDWLLNRCQRRQSN